MEGAIHYYLMQYLIYEKFSLLARGVWTLNHCLLLNWTFCVANAFFWHLNIGIAIWLHF